MSRERKISLCMIVKDEEDWIARCILSVQPIVHEVIVVDTGSQDRTVEIAQTLGAKIFTRTWDNDFAVARNYSIEKAEGDWILVLDADEMIAPSDLENLYALTKDRLICTEFLQRHYTDDHRLSDFTPCRGEFPEIEKGHAGFFESNCCRLFPHGEGLHFQGRIHELVEHSIHALKKHKIVRTPIRIHHFGHTAAVRSKKKKGDLYSPLGEIKAQEMPTDWKAFYELGIEHNVNGRRKESIEAFKRSLELNPNYIATWVNCGYAQMESELYDEAIQSFKEAIKRDPACAEAYCNIGVVGMRTKNLKLAEDAALRAISITPHYVNALLNLGRTYVMAGRLSEAVAVFLHTLRILPQCIAAKADLRAVFLQGGVLSEAKRYLEGALKDDPNHVNATLNIQSLRKLQSV